MTRSGRDHLGHPPDGRSPRPGHRTEAATFRAGTRPTAHRGGPERLEAVGRPDGYDLGTGPAGADGTGAGRAR
ncbi:hypothetical protein [Streptomyces carpaticus]|uniref:Uncharacterized protein n=1 Tax=Streptomyces carpaticus TaxID=285558 RepID=A0ABV4ZIV4_9ACTN